MKIVLDSQIFDLQKYGGISKYYVEVFKRLSSKDDVIIQLSFDITNNINFINSCLCTKKIKFNLKIIKFLSLMGISTRSLVKKNNSKLLRKITNENNFDIFIPTYYSTDFLDKINGKPFILTVYDMIHELLPEYFSNDTLYVVENKLKLMQCATKIIAVSHNTKNDILKLYPHIDNEKIVVIHHGVSIKVNSDVRLNLPSNYILFVGSRSNYKNFVFMIESIHTLLVDNKDLYLVCAGGGEFDQEEISIFNELNIRDKIRFVDFKDYELGSIYANAKCFIFPSKYEGFGLPVLESMACGCPVILSKSSSFPEVASDAALYFELGNKNDLITKVNLIFTNEVLRDKLIKRGFIRANEMSWDLASEKIYNLLNTIN